MRILILEDDAVLGQTLEAVVLGVGGEVTCVHSLELAAQALDGNQHFDVAVFDLNIKEEDSLSLLQNLKSKNARIKIVAMTGGGKIEPRVGLPLATAIGADETLFKPFTNEEFLNAISLKKVS